MGRYIIGDTAEPQAPEPKAGRYIIGDVPSATPAESPDAAAFREGVAGIPGLGPLVVGLAQTGGRMIGTFHRAIGNDEAADQAFRNVQRAETASREATPGIINTVMRSVGQAAPVAAPMAVATAMTGGATIPLVAGTAASAAMRGSEAIQEAKDAQVGAPTISDDEIAKRFNTKLAPEQEVKFQEWKSKYAPRDSGYDYDYRGAFLDGLKPSEANGHWSDKYKKPNHPTFSNESMYAKDMPGRAGHWRGETYVPPSGPRPATAEELTAHVASQAAIDAALNGVLGLTGGQAVSAPVKAGIAAVVKRLGVNVGAAEAGLIADQIARKGTGVNPTDSSKWTEMAFEAALASAAQQGAFEAAGYLKPGRKFNRRDIPPAPPEIESAAWEAAWEKAGHDAHMKRVADRAQNKFDNEPYPGPAKDYDQQVTEALRRGDGSSFKDVSVGIAPLGDNPLGRVSGGGETPRITQAEPSAEVGAPLTHQTRGSIPGIRLPDIERIQEAPTTGPELASRGVVPLGRLRGDRRNFAPIPEIPGRPGMPDIEQMRGGQEPPRLGPEGSPVFAPGPDTPEMGGMGGGPVREPLPSRNSGTEGAGPMAEGPQIQKFSGYRNPEGVLTVGMGQKTPTMPQEARSPEVAQVPVSAPESPSIASVAYPVPPEAGMPTGRTRTPGGKKVAPPDDDLFGPNAGVLNVSAMRELPGAILRKVARGNDPQGMQPIRENRTNTQSGFGWDLQKIVGEYDDALKAEYPKQQRPDIERLANVALQGETTATDSTQARQQSVAAMAQLSPKVRTAVQKARDFLDKTSADLVKRGIGTDSTLAKVADNLGIWAKRSYQVFDDPGWMEAIEQNQKWNEWGRERAASEIAKGSPDYSVEQGMADNKAMLAKMAGEGQGRYLNQTTLGKSDLSSFKKRNEIPQWMREMMGQYSDFRVNFTKSAKSNANMIANHQFQNEIGALGDGKFIFEKPTKDAYVPFPDTGEYGVLQGKYTTPEFLETMRSTLSTKGEGPIDQLLAGTSAIARFNKTAGNFPRGSIRQIPSNFKSGVQAGHIGPSTFLTPKGWKQLSDTGKVAWSAFRGRENVNVSVLMDDLHKRDVLNSDAIQSLQKESVESAIGPQSSVGRLAGRVPGGRKAIEGVQKASDFLSDFYMLPDNAQKVNGYLSEMEMYKHKVESGEWTMEQLKDHAADVVKDVYPTHSRVLRLAEKGRNIPGVSDFVFYKSERIRNNVSLIKRIGIEMKDKDPQVQSIGVKRALGLIAGMAGAPIALSLANQQIGVTDALDAEWRNLSEGRLPWLNNSSLLYSEHATGKAEIMDVGYMDSDQEITDAVRAMVNGEDWQSKIQNSAEEFLGNFVGKNMAINIWAGIATGLDPRTGQPIGTKGDSWLQQRLAEGAWAMRQGEPGAAGIARHGLEAAKGLRDPSAVAMELVGPGTYKLDAGDLLKTAVFDYNSTVRAQRHKVNSTKRTAPETTGAARTESNDRLKLMFRELTGKVKSARAVGMTKPQIRKVLKEAGFSEDDQTKVLNNVWNSKALGIK